MGMRVGAGAGSAPRADPVLLPLSRLEGPIADAARVLDARKGLPRHSERVALYAALLAEHLGLGEETCNLIRLASLLHDVGKLGIPTELLHKPGELDTRERALVQRHTELGHRWLTRAAHPALVLAPAIAHTHHERFDGSGYPSGLSKNRIPAAGRIVAVADVLEALTSERCYRPAFSLEEVLGMIDEGRRRDFDPAVVDALLDPRGKPFALVHHFSGTELGANSALG
jgi:HD-GYP domain-containing protein (c-di-GMP phosphodiesterase class II)